MSTEQMMIAILDKLDKMESKFDSRMDKLEARMDSLEARIDSLESEMKSMKSQMDYMNQKINLLNKKTDDMRVEAKFFQRSIQKDIAKLQDAQDTIITVLESKGILKADGNVC